MKRLLFVLRSAVVIPMMLALVVFVFAEGEKEYIVYPSVQFFSMDEQTNPAGFIVVGEEDLAEMLEADMVDRYEENITGEFFEIEYDSTYTDYIEQHDMNMIKAKKAWELGCFGQGVRVAVIDSGVRPHVEFKNQLKDGIHYYTEDNKLKYDYDTSDILSHGTFITGMIASAHDGYGIKSLAPKVEIVPFKVCDANGNITAASVSNAISAAVNTYNCDILNLSLGFSSDSDTLRLEIQNALDNGVIVVAAVGNYTVNSDGTVVKNDALSYPAAYEGVIGVGSVSYETGAVSYFSRKNSSVFITAPGEDVVSCYIKDKNGNDADTYAKSSGTSFSAPLVTATAAILKNANPTLTSSDIAYILQDSATDAGDAGYDEVYGYGILDVKKALECTISNPPQNEAPQKISYIVRAQNPELNGAICINGYTTGHVDSCTMNESFTASAEKIYMYDGVSYEFAYWANGNGTYVSGSTSYTFNATSNFTLEAVYDEVMSDEAKTKAVEFWNGNGVYLDKLIADSNGYIDKNNIPEPEITGYLFNNTWKNEDGSVFDETAQLTKGLTRVVAQFEDDEETTFTASFADDKNAEERSGVYGTYVTYTAKDPDSFDYCKIGDSIISYNPTIELALWDNVTVTAEYSGEKAAIVPSVTLAKKDDAYFILYNTPQDYETIDAGIVFGIEKTAPTVGSFYSKASVKNLSDFAQFTALPGNSETHTVARGYLIYRNKISKTINVIYSD